MTSRTIFLGKLLGAYIIIFAAAMLFNSQGMIAAVGGLFQDASLMLVLGVVVVAAGLAMVFGHNVWSGGALPVVVTVVGWLTLLKGLILLLLPSGGQQAYFVATHFAQFPYVYAAISFVLGAYLLVASLTARRT